MATGDLPGAIAAVGLPGQASPLSERPLEDMAWDRVVRFISTERLEGLLLHAVETGALPATGQQHEQARDLHLLASSRVLYLEQRLLEVDRLLRGADIDVLVLKGSAHAHLAYPDPNLRSFGDVDLLIRAEQLYDALDLLSGELGAVRQVPEFRRGFDARFGKAVALTGADGIELDVHRTLLFGSFAFRFAPEELFDAAVDLPLGGRNLRALGPEHRLLHACIHTVLRDIRPRYSSVRDVAQMLLTGDHDLDRLLVIVRRWDAQVLLQQAAVLCRTVLGADADGALPPGIVDYQPTERDRRVLDSHLGANHRHVDKVLASLPFIDGATSKLRFVVSSALPGRRFAASQDGATSFLRRGWRSLARRSGTGGIARILRRHPNG